MGSLVSTHTRGWFGYIPRFAFQDPGQQENLLQTATEIPASGISILIYLAFRPPNRALTYAASRKEK